MEKIYPKYTPSNFPEYEWEGKSQEYGEYYLTTYQLQSKRNQHYIYKLNAMGEVTFYKATPSICFNFKKVEIDGKKDILIYKLPKNWEKEFPPLYQVN